MEEVGASVDMGSFSHYLQGFLYMLGGDRRISSINSMFRLPTMNVPVGSFWKFHL